MSHQIGSDNKYILPAYTDAIPEQFSSNKNPRLIPCSVQTINIPSLTSSAGASGTSILQIPCGSSAGLMCNPYLRLSLQTTQTANAANSRSFKGSVGAATALINNISTYVNSVQVDNIQSYDQVMDILLSHSSSSEYLSHDGQVLMTCNVADASASSYQLATSATATYVIPLIGLLGSQQCFPLYLVNGVLQLQINYNSIARAFFCVTNSPTSMTISNVQLVYDRVQPEQAFVDSVRNSMMLSGAKYVYGYTNYQCSTMNSLNGQQTLNYGLNVSSLRGIVSNQITTADLSSATAQGLSIVNGLSQYIVSLDGRLLNNNVLDAVNTPAVVFAEANKCMGRLFDASISDTSTAATYPTNNFFVGVSAQRTSENLSFSGSPVSIVGQQVTTTSANCTLHNVFISDFQLLLDVAGSIEIVR